MNKFYMNGKLMHKASDHNTKRCEVEKWVFLSHSDFERLKANPYQEHEAITAAKDLMFEDEEAYHCIMLLDEHGDDSQFEACIHCHGVLILLPIKYFSTIILTAACRYDMIRNGLSKL